VIEGARVIDDEETEHLRGSVWFEKLEAELTAGRALRVYRTNAGLTLTTLSEKTGTPISHLSVIEHDALEGRQDADLFALLEGGGADIKGRCSISSIRVFSLYSETKNEFQSQTPPPTRATEFGR
jgi:transcriptional regulator with XRE-family HTH domain